MLTKNQIELTDHFSNLVVKSMEVINLKQAVMALMARNVEPGAAEVLETDVTLEEVKEDLDAARVDMLDMMGVFMETLEEHCDEQESEQGTTGSTPETGG